MRVFRGIHKTEAGSCKLTTLLSWELSYRRTGPQSHGVDAARLADLQLSTPPEKLIS
jgi:hypothetical protein